MIELRAIRVTDRSETAVPLIAQTDSGNRALGARRIVEQLIERRCVPRQSIHFATERIVRLQSRPVRTNKQASFFPACLLVVGSRSINHLLALRLEHADDGHQLRVLFLRGRVRVDAVHLIHLDVKVRMYVPVYSGVGFLRTE